MFDGLLQPTHLLLILIIVLIVFGPGKVPELGKALGQGIREMRESLSPSQPPATPPTAPPTPAPVQQPPQVPEPLWYQPPSVPTEDPASTTGEKSAQGPAGSYPPS